MSREFYFRYRGRSRRRIILEVDFEESRVVDLMVFGITCIRIEILICVCIKRNVITLDLLKNSWVYILMNGPKRPVLLRYGSRDTRHLDFPRVDG